MCQQFVGSYINSELLAHIFAGFFTLDPTVRK